MKQIIFYVLIASLFFCSCNKERLFNDLSELSGTGVIQISSDNVSGKIGEIFSKYIYTTVPNGGRVEIFGTSGVSDEQMEYARDILEHYFATDGTTYNSQVKEIIANSMANKKSAMVFFDNQELSESSLLKLIGTGYNFQDLYASESLNSGNRDASYEEILHLVHNYGIAPTLFEYQNLLQQANDAAIANGLYTPASDLPKADYEDEYFAAIMDCYLGLWVGTDGTMFGEYTLTSKEEMQAQDPAGYKLIQDLFGDIQLVR